MFFFFFIAIKDLPWCGVNVNLITLGFTAYLAMRIFVSCAIVKDLRQHARPRKCHMVMDNVMEMVQLGWIIYSAVLFFSPDNKCSGI